MPSYPTTSFQISVSIKKVAPSNCGFSTVQKDKGHKMTRHIFNVFIVEKQCKYISFFGFVTIIVQYFVSIELCFYQPTIKYLSCPNCIFRMIDFRELKLLCYTGTYTVQVIWITLVLDMVVCC